MKNFTTILLLVAVFGFFAMMTATSTTAGAGVMESETTSGSGGGGSGSSGSSSSSSSGGGSGGGGGSDPEPESEPEMPEYFLETRLRQELDIISGIEITASAENRPARTRLGMDGEGNLYTYIEPKSCDGSLWFNIIQGTQDTDYLPLSPSLEVERRDEKGRFQVEVRFPFIFRQDVDGWTAPPSGSMGWEDPFDTGFRFDTHISLRHNEFYEWPNGHGEEPVVTETNDIRGSVNFWFKSVEAENVRLWVEDYTWAVHYGNDLRDVFDGMQIRADFELEWAGDMDGLAALNSTFPLAVPTPEPATMILLGTGGYLAVLRRRRRLRS